MQKPLPSEPATAPPPPLEFDDLLTFAAWLYYVDGLTQSDVAQRLGVSRASVVNYLQDARTRGIVSIRLDPAAASRIGLARRLAERFGLVAAHVIPSIPDGGDAGRPDRRIGAAGARILSDMLKPGDTVGVAWGRTVLAAARATVASEVKGLTIVQASGSSLSTDDFSPELCTSLLANQLGARCLNFHAPVVLSSRALRDQLLAEPSLQRQFEHIRAADIILFGVGDIGPGSTFAGSGMADEAELAELRETEAIGIVIGRLIDAKGEAVASDLDARIVGISLAELKQVPVRLCVAGGAHKRAAIAAALTGGCATHFVTDAATAEALLAAE
jgi:DNA-binding transcriptional regulator LsrR (DeoR family)